jgi:hypothetical protein
LLNVHLIGQHLTPELVTWATSLRERATIYSFSTTRELLVSWALAKSTGNYDILAPNAVVWLQSRPGQYSQAEIDAAQIADPLARPVIVAGALCAGEPRSGKLLLDVTRLYWHQPQDALWDSILTVGLDVQTTSQWIAIHAAQLADYEGLAGLCQTLGLSTLWQNDRWPVISSEPAYRLFRGWRSWERWCDDRQSWPDSVNATRAILVLDFPTPDDVGRARDSGIDHVLATPFRATDLRNFIGPRQRRASRACNVVSQSGATPRVYGRAG